MTISKCDQILKKSLIENFIFCAEYINNLASFLFVTFSVFKSLHGVGVENWNIKRKWIVNFIYELVFKSLTTNVPTRIETSRLIYIANQLAGFYMMGNTGR